jgi:hypothetical protein
LIAAERDRQVSAEGYTAEHDDSHSDFELSSAARCYVQQAWRGDVTRRIPAEWPWHADDWKPSPDAIRNLVKAGALIVAEIDRLIRAESKP